MRKLSNRKELDGKRPAEWTQETGYRSRLQKAMAMRRTLRSDDNCVPFVANVCRCVENRTHLMPGQKDKPDLHVTATVNWRRWLNTSLNLNLNLNVSAANYLWFNLTFSEIGYSATLGQTSVLMDWRCSQLELILPPSAAAAQSQGSLAECMRGTARTKTKRMWQQPSNIGTFIIFRVLARAGRTKDFSRQATAAVAATSRQLLVTCHVAAGMAQDQRTKGRWYERTTGRRKECESGRHCPALCEFLTKGC
ncbi:GD22048 [Drosophila simulans]|uniref:GD22048 n=1 Tax=Drosophila simulans TaxID=7240 RepID=B4Q549_DROSI|nr:GD22048 [Drosophila simulans]